jgi:hypothetical protein
LRLYAVIVKRYALRLIASTLANQIPHVMQVRNEVTFYPANHRVGIAATYHDGGNLRGTCRHYAAAVGRSDTFAAPH